MANYKRKSKLKSIICGILVVATLIGACAGIAALGKKETKTIGAGAFKVGGVNDSGNYEKSNVSIYTEDMFECQGLVIEPEFEASGTYRVFYYDSNKNFIGATEVMNAADSIYTKGNSFILAKYARIMITPDAVDEDGKADKDFKIRFYEAYGYASNFSITVNKKQNEVGKENLFVHMEENVGKICASKDGYFEERESAQGNSYVLIDVRGISNLALEYEEESLDFSYFFYDENKKVVSSGLFEMGVYDIKLDVPENAVEFGLIYRPNNQPFVYAFK